MQVKNTNNNPPVILLLSSSSPSALRASSNLLAMAPSSPPTAPLPLQVSAALHRAWQTCRWEALSPYLSSNSLRVVLVL